jgi:hypothetical protein
MTIKRKEPLRGRCPRAPASFLEEKKQKTRKMSLRPYPVGGKLEGNAFKLVGSITREKENARNDQAGKRHKDV